MDIVKLIITIVFIIVCVALSALVLMQEGKSAGLGSIGGLAETYWGKNKGRSKEGMMIRITAVLSVLFFLLSLVLNLSFF